MRMIHECQEAWENPLATPVMQKKEKSQPWEEQGEEKGFLEGMKCAFLRS